MGDERRSREELLAEIETLRKQLDDASGALETLREREARAKRIIENMPDVISELDAAGRPLYITPNLEHIIGYRREDMLGISLRDPVMQERFHPEDRERLRVPLPEIFRPDASTERVYRFRVADGRWRWFETRGRAFRGPDGEMHVVTVSRDVHERVEAEHRLHQSEERYRALFETTSDVVIDLDDDGRVTLISPSVRDVLGYEKGELVGTTPFSLLHADDVERLAGLFLERVETRRPQGEGAVFRVRHRDGSWRWLQGGGVRYETQAGEAHVVAVARDITDRVIAVEERRQLELRMQQAQKIESLGVMAGGVAHDFNNLLTPILGDASLALMDVPADSPARARLLKIQRAAHHAANLTNQLLDYAGVGPLDSQPLDLSELVRDMAQLLESTISQRARLRYDFADGLPSVDADAAQVSQVAMNLITNASEAIEASGSGAGHIRLRSGVEDLDADALGELISAEGLKPGTYVWFEVEDDGSGMDPETHSRIFDPFFTTKFTGRGLGLAAVLGIVRRHRGGLQIDTRLGEGTRIQVFFPAVAALARTREADTQPTTLRGSGKILVVDDDEGVRDLIGETLRRAGFEPLLARDGGEAVQIFRSHADGIKLVMLDLTMPGASGEATLDQLRSLQSEVRVLLVSGYSEQNNAERLAGRRVDGFLQKPFLPETLLAYVHELAAD